MGYRAAAGACREKSEIEIRNRAFDAKSGEERWLGRLPVPGVANPMTYLWNGEQYVAIAAGGHSESRATIGDSVVAFCLPRQGEAPSLWSRTIEPAWRALPGQGNRARARDHLDRGRGVARAPPREMA